MPTSKIPSPARSQGVISTPRKQIRRTRSVSTPARTNLRLSSIIESYKVSPMPNRQSVLNDNTDIDMPRCDSWWKKIDDNSRDVLELLERKELVEVNNVAEEFDVEVLSQEKNNYTLDLPESSDAESINSIIIPQRKLFTQKENNPQIKFGQIKNNRETLQKLNKSYKDQDKEINIKRKTLFTQPSKPRPKPVFPAALLDMSPNKTVNKTKEIPAAENKGQGQVRSLFGVRPGKKRKNMFADFIASESEDEISEIQPKVFGFQKRKDPKGRGSLMSRHSRTSSIDLEMDDWILLPSSTMVENHTDEQTSPAKRMKLSNQLKDKDSDVNTNSNNTINKTKQANTSISSKNQSKNLSNVHYEDDKNNETNITPRNATTNNSRITRSMGKSLRENSITASIISKDLDNSKNQTQNRKSKSIKNLSQRKSHSVQEKQRESKDQPVPDFTAEYDNEDNEVVLKIGKSPKDKTASNPKVDVVDNKTNFVKETSRKISNENFVEPEKSTDKSCVNEAELLDNKKNEIQCNEVSNYSIVQNNSQEVRKVAKLNKESNVQKLNKSIDKNKNKSITNRVENNNEDSIQKDIRKERISENQSRNKDVQKNVNVSKSSQHFNNENPEVEMESENEDNQSDSNSEQSDIENPNESTQIADGNGNENEYQETDTNQNITEEEAVNNVQVTNANNTDESDKEIMLNDQHDNLKDKTQVSLPKGSHDTTGKNRIANKSPEVILHDKTRQTDSFIVQGPRNTSVRKTKSIIFHKKLEAVEDFRKSAGFSDVTGSSSAEGSGWDSHRTTRKTLRQTFGKDFTPRKSLRALVMEKTAKLQANFTEVLENIKFPQANSTKYDHVQDEMDFHQETELEEVENIEMVEVAESEKTLQTKEDQQVNVRCVTDRMEERDITKQLQRDDKEQFEENDDDMGPSESIKRNKAEQCKEREVEESEERDKIEESEVREEIENFEEKEMQDAEEDEEMENSKQREMDAPEENREIDREVDSEDEEVKESEVREEIEESEEEEEVENSKLRGKMEDSEDREDMVNSEDEEVEESEAREEIEESEKEEEVENSKLRGEMEDSEDREDMLDSEDEEVEESEVREEIEEFEEEEVENSKLRGEMEDSEDREDTVDSGGEEVAESEVREEIEESEERQEMEESSEREEMDESVERDEREQSESEEDETEQIEEMEQPEERDDAEQSDNGERNETVPNDEIIVDRRTSSRSRQTSLETYLQKIKQDNVERRRVRQEELRNSLKNPKRDTFNAFKVPQRPVRTLKIQKPKAKRINSATQFGTLPPEVVEDMKYKPPKRFRPNNASWITNRLYKFLENKLEPKYDYKARVRAERLTARLHALAAAARRTHQLPREEVDDLKREMARLAVVTTHYDFYEFCREFLPREVRIKVVPDIVNDIPLPRHGVFSDILE